MKNYLLLSTLTIIELIISLVIYSFCEGFWEELNVNWITLSANFGNFSFFEFMIKSLSWFIQCLIQEGFKLFLLYFLLLIVFNYLSLKNLISNNASTTVTYFLIAFVFFSLIFDSNFYQNVLSTINSIVSIIIASIFISKISKKIIKIINLETKLIEM